MRRKITLLLMLLLLLPLPSLAQEQSSVLTYLYVPACQSCAKAKAVLAQLGAAAQVAAADGATFVSPVEVRELNLVSPDDLLAAQALFEAYAVPEDEQIAPMVFLRDRYLSGAEAIERELLTAVQAGEALSVQEPLPEAAGSRLSAQSVMGTLAAGLIAGFNPCALSMLLVLLCTLLQSSRPAGRYAAVFLLVKGVCYFLIGTLLVGLLSAAKLAWLPQAVRILTTAITAVLIALNLSDAFQAYHEHYGAIRDQLPGTVRKRLDQFIRKRVAEAGGKLWVTIVIVAVCVAFSEFLCAGQVYLATLIAGVHSGVRTGAMLGLLAVYCLSFLLPSAVLSVVVCRTKAYFESSNRIRRWMPAIKLCTAAVLLAALIILWR